MVGCSGLVVATKVWLVFIMRLASQALRRTLLVGFRSSSAGKRKWKELPWSEAPGPERGADGNGGGADADAHGPVPVADADIEVGRYLGKWVGR